MTKKWIDYSDQEIFALCIGIGVGLGLLGGTLLQTPLAGLAIGLGLGVAAAELVKRSRDRRRGPDEPV